jgi:heme-degrading monooxygenase HmoA
MPILSSEYLTVINLFRTDTSSNQDTLIGAMREIVDAAAYEGWVSSTVHGGQDKLGTANFIQWRSGRDLEKRYAGEEFKHRTIPQFTELTTSIRLLQTTLAATMRHPAQGDRTEIGPHRDDYTVIELLGVDPAAQEDLVGALGDSGDWLLETRGYRSYSVLRGLRARGVGHGTQLAVTPSGPADGAFVVTYSQWDSKQAYDAFRDLPKQQQPEQRQKTQAQLDSLITSCEWNTYRVVHSRSAGP